MKLRLELVSKYRNEIYGLCAIWIVLLHVISNFGFDPSSLIPLLAAPVWLLKCSFGVDVFLFLSGVSLYYSFSSDGNLHRYLIKRVRRIIPALLTTFAVKWVVSFLYGQVGITWLLWHLTLLPFYVEGNLDGAWFIAFIAVLYLLYPFIHSIVYGPSANASSGERGMLLRTLALCAAFAAVYWLSHKYALDWFWKVEIALGRVPIFILGCYFGHLVKGKRVLRTSQSVLVMVAFLVWFAVLVFVISASPWWWRLYASASGAIFAYCLAIALSCCSRFLRSSLWGGVGFALRSVGCYSMELYCTHLIFYYGVGPFVRLDGSIAQLVFYTVLSFLYAWGAVRYFEPWLLKAWRSSPLSKALSW